jgi:hypothetical protein
MASDPWKALRPREPACDRCGARGGHYVTCPDLGKPLGAKDPEVCEKCHLTHRGECF